MRPTFMYVFQSPFQGRYSFERHTYLQQALPGHIAVIKCGKPHSQQSQYHTWLCHAMGPFPEALIATLAYRRGPTKVGESLRYTWRRLRADSHTKTRSSSSTHTPVGPQKSFSRSNPQARSRSCHISALASSFSFPHLEIVASPVSAVTKVPSASKTCSRLLSQSAT